MDKILYIKKKTHPKSKVSENKNLYTLITIREIETVIKQYPPPQAPQKTKLGDLA